LKKLPIEENLNRDCSEFINSPRKCENQAHRLLGTQRKREIASASRWPAVGCGSVKVIARFDRLNLG
jgi:hypothetical protein